MVCIHPPVWETNSPKKYSRKFRVPSDRKVRLERSSCIAEPVESVDNEEPSNAMGQSMTAKLSPSAMSSPETCAGGMPASHTVAHAAAAKANAPMVNGRTEPS